MRERKRQKHKGTLTWKGPVGVHGVEHAGKYLQFSGSSVSGVNNTLSGGGGTGTTGNWHH